MKKSSKKKKSKRNAELEVSHDGIPSAYRDASSRFNILFEKIVKNNEMRCYSVFLNIVVTYLIDLHIWVI